MATSRTASAKNKKVGMKDGAFGGFTIIEVVLVLAIAGLIFLMVFIALPQLQRAQRDTQRRQDLGRLEGAITQYQTNNNGKIPTQSPDIDSKDFIQRYVVGVNGNPEEDFVDPLGTPYEIIFSNDSVDTSSGGAAYDAAGKGEGQDFKIYMYGGAKCEDEKVVTVKNQPRTYAIQYRLEGSGVYCQDNAG